MTKEVTRPRSWPKHPKQIIRTLSLRVHAPEPEYGTPDSSPARGNQQTLVSNGRRLRRGRLRFLWYLSA